MFKLSDLSDGKGIDDFIKANSLKLKSAAQIEDRIRNSKSFFGFDKEVLVSYAEFATIKDLFKDEFIQKVESGEEKWGIKSIAQAVKDFADYMKFAWGKALDERGISASRSIEKLSAWMWLLSRDDLDNTLNDDDLYNPYGAPALIKCCEILGIEVSDNLREFAKHKCQ
jgi:hypothetical protein